MISLGCYDFRHLITSLQRLRQCCRGLFNQGNKTLLQLSIQSYTDGPTPGCYREILASWRATWDAHYTSYAELEFLSPINIKLVENRDGLPEALKYIERIRNPDLYFFEKSKKVELGGLEITDHSPDGSNIEKRYPFLWASRRQGINAFTVTRYLKQRPSRGSRRTGQINRFPSRHAFRNQQLLREWTPGGEDGRGHLVQYLPLRELHLEDLILVPTTIKELLGSWSQLGEFYAHSLAVEVLSRPITTPSCSWLEDYKDKLSKLAEACMANATRETEASSLLKTKDRWIQVYNTRPDSGHWERGEGQFDSIDGRIMFTLDEISLLPESDRPAAFDFLMPQMVSSHAWIAEQRDRDYGSKRLRNLMVELASHCTTRFADQLTKEDWWILSQNRQLLLERMDWGPAVYRVCELVPASKRATVARVGIDNWPSKLLEAVEGMLSDENLFFSSHRAYIPGWQDDLKSTLLKLTTNSKVLIPRIPAAMLEPILKEVPCTVIPAENCVKAQLVMLRQLHRSKSN